MEPDEVVDWQHETQDNLAEIFVEMWGKSWEWLSRAILEIQVQ